MLEIDLKKRLALVTGGSRGIGASIVETLCLAGAHTVFTHTGNPRNRQRIDALLSRIRDRGGKVDERILDCTDSALTTACVNALVQEHGKIDILVCNVGGRDFPRLPEDEPDQEWRKYIDLNLTSAFYITRAVLPHMRKASYGRIILIGSSAVFDGGGGSMDYAAAKAGLRGMMAFLCRNYARKGILTNIIHPCVIDTEGLQNRYKDAESRSKLIDQIPAGRLGRPEDIAGLVAYLASAGGDYICGQEILADGGRTFFSR